MVECVAVQRTLEAVYTESTTGPVSIREGYDASRGMCRTSIPMSAEPPASVRQQRAEGSCARRAWCTVRSRASERAAVSG
eukprot:495204-Pleurochrysis_carterae.AAC.1